MAVADDGTYAKLLFDSVAVIIAVDITSPAAIVTMFLRLVLMLMMLLKVMRVLIF